MQATKKNTISSRQRHKELSAYLHRNYRRLQKIDSGNITGFSIRKKISKDKKQRQFAIVFHVRKKLVPAQSQKTIPGHITVSFSDGKKRKVKTDVIEVGAFSFHAGIGSSVRKNISAYGGSIGIFLKDKSEKIYGITCYHVLGADLISAGNLSYSKSGNLEEYDVIIQDRNGSPLPATFCAGRISKEIDAALVYIPKQTLEKITINEVAGNRLGNSVATNCLHRTVKGFGFKNYNKTAIVESISGIVMDDLTGYHLTGLVQVDRVITLPGDSGCLLALENPLLPVGILVGSDQKHSYAIPISKIMSYFTLNII